MARQKAASDTGLVERVRAFQKSAKANRRCADCTELGPTYICTDYATFVCQICSGIHREFGHKIRGISLSDWTQKEVETIEQGGNDRAAEKWLARWKSEHCAQPDNTQADRIRDFIRQKYVERKWLGRGESHGKCADDGSRVQSRTGLQSSAATASPAAASNWVADFSSPTVAPAALQVDVPAPADAPWVADFSSMTATPGHPGISLVATQQQPPALITSESHGINPCLLGLDFTADEKKAEVAALEAAAKKAAEEKAAEAVRAEKMALVLEVGAREAAINAAGTPGKQLRDAVLSGSGDVVKRLFEDSLQNGEVGRISQLRQQVNALPPAPPPVTHFYIGDGDCPVEVCSTAEVPMVQMARSGQQKEIGLMASNDCSSDTRTSAASVNMFDDDDFNDISPPREFDDLIHAFQEKNPVLGFDL